MRGTSSVPPPTENLVESVVFEVFLSGVWCNYFIDKGCNLHKCLVFHVDFKDWNCRFRSFHNFPFLRAAFCDPILLFQTFLGMNIVIFPPFQSSKCLCRILASNFMSQRNENCYFTTFQNSRCPVGFKLEVSFINHFRNGNCGYPDFPVLRGTL